MSARYAIWSCRKGFELPCQVFTQPGKPNWFCAYSIWNPETLKNKRLFRSTKTSDKKQALEICRTWHRAALKARNGKLSVDTAREVIARGVSDVFTAANIESLPSAPSNRGARHGRKPKQSRLRNPRTTVTSASLNGSPNFSERKPGAIFPRCKRTTYSVSRSRGERTITRDRQIELKVPRVCFGEAGRQGLLTVNPASRVKLLKSSKESKRRAFTLSEIKRILRARRC